MARRDIAAPTTQNFAGAIAHAAFVFDIPTTGLLQPWVRCRRRRCCHDAKVPFNRLLN